MECPWAMNVLKQNAGRICNTRAQVVQTFNLQAKKHTLPSVDRINENWTLGSHSLRSSSHNYNIGGQSISISSVHLVLSIDRFMLWCVFYSSRIKVGGKAQDDNDHDDEEEAGGRRWMRKRQLLTTFIVALCFSSVLDWSTSFVDHLHIKLTAITEPLKCCDHHQYLTFFSPCVLLVRRHDLHFNY